MLRCCWRPFLNLGRPYSTKTAPPIAALRAFLAPENLSASQPVTYNPKAIHKLYTAIKALPPRPGYHPLRSYELDQLLVLFGSLSIPPPRPKCIYIHPFVSRIPPAPFRTHWSLVLELAEQIRVRENRKPRTGAHHYWVMRAHLARMRTIPSLRDDSATEATARYRRIRNTADPEVHVPYLGSMLALCRPTHLPQIVKYLCDVLSRYPNPDHRFADLLWEIILAEPSVMPDPIQARILEILWTRIERHPYMSAMRNPKPPMHAFDTVSHKHIRIGITVPQLCSALATSLFPHFRLRLPSQVWMWAADEARAVFSPQTPAPARWGSLMLLAMYAAPALSSSVVTNGGLVENEGHVVWRTVFALGLLERTVLDESSSTVRRLWRMWRNAKTEHVPPLVRRVIVGAFLRLSARTRDTALTEACQRFCSRHSLWGGGDTKADVVQMTELFVDYAYAALYNGARPHTDAWAGIFATLPQEWHARVADALFRSFVEQDFIAAQQLHAFCQQQEIAISTDSTYALALVLAEKYYPEEALQFLGDERLSLDRLEELLDRIMRTLRRERHAFPLKFSLRYALSVLIASGRGQEAITLLRVIFTRRPSVFSIHYMLRVMRSLLLHLVRDGFPAVAWENFRRKLVLRLALKGAHTMAEHVYRFGGVKSGKRTARDALVRAVRFRVKQPAKPLAFKIVPILARRPNHVPTLRLAVTLLVRSGRLGAARQVLARAHQEGIDTATMTWLGNTLLDGTMWAARNKHGRLMRHVLSMRDLLVRRFGFVQDRVTLNILIKALLRWKTYDPAQIRRLLDHLVSTGYPCPARFRHEDGVFGTLSAGESGKVEAISTLGLPAFISFDRHVRPLYKMFVKALHLRGDLRGARTVVGILQAVQDEVLVRRQERRRVRLAGILRKKAR
ncbi:hypothetical protein FB45DRAFT_887786 [Roridomyces roridus]|uniref:Uncharacterized protein n=1 Tax=Roridomyces roridus TaxID=1738132 RepID=A0AAD7G264_9AGAR|nr:hypothetical protein FB45DRAFT_887786 [Roridomyces roridus]